MSGKKKILALILILLILSVCAAGMAWHTKHYYIIDLSMYPKDAKTLDLREEEISVAHYQKIRKKLPNCEILWQVPFQDGRYPYDIRQLEVNRLNDEDLEALTCFVRLETLDATGCSDYAQLQKLQTLCPELEVQYRVTVDGEVYDASAEEITLSGISQEELENLQYLPRLKQVRITGAEDPDRLAALTEYCREREISVGVEIGGKFLAESTRSLTLQTVTEAELPLLALLPQLNKVHIQNPQAKADSLLQLQQDRPGLVVTWEKEILGVRFAWDTEEIDLLEALSAEGTAAYEFSRTVPIHGDRDEITYLFAIKDKYPLPDMTLQTDALIRQVEEAMAYFPLAKKVLLLGGLLDNEAMAQFRERHREDYQVVWTVKCGKMAARTDSPYFMPTKYHVYYFHDEDGMNLRYCENMVSIDLGHMSITRIDWVRYMPDLEHLVLAHTDVRSIEPIRNCKKLKFLELDWSAVQSYEPLTGCTALEDLNLGNTNRDFTPIGEMTWLKNLWMVGCNSGAAYRMTQALTGTRVMASGSATVANGWRELPNYYAMRDNMNMYYMKW